MTESIPKTIRLCRSSDTSRVTHAEHSGGLTFCGKDAGWYSGLGWTTETGALAAVTCKRCRKSLAARQRERVIRASSAMILDAERGEVR